MLSMIFIEIIKINKTFFGNICLKKQNKTTMQCLYYSKCIVSMYLEDIILIIFFIQLIYCITLEFCKVQYQTPETTKSIIITTLQNHNADTIATLVNIALLQISHTTF